LAQIFTKLDMMFDALARRTIFSTLDNDSVNLVMAYHGNTFFGLDPTLLTWGNLSELRLRLYKPYIQDFSVRPVAFGLLIKLHLRVDVDTVRFLMDNQRDVSIHVDKLDYDGVSWKRVSYHDHRIYDFRGERNLEAIKIEGINFRGEPPNRRDEWFQVERVRSITEDWLG
jgi:hypothetical protein